MVGDLRAMGNWPPREKARLATSPFAGEPGMRERCWADFTALAPILDWDTRRSLYFCFTNE